MPYIPTDSVLIYAHACSSMPMSDMSDYACFPRLCRANPESALAHYKKCKRVTDQLCG